MSATWDTSFVAVSVLVGEPVDSVARTLGASASAPAIELLRKLGEGAGDIAAATSREARARALARVISELAVAVDAMRLA
jgi:hypothetical protein